MGAGFVVRSFLTDHITSGAGGKRLFLIVEQRLPKKIVKRFRSTWYETMIG